MTKIFFVNHDAIANDGDIRVHNQIINGKINVLLSFHDWEVSAPMLGTSSCLVGRTLMLVVVGYLPTIGSLYHQSCGLFGYTKIGCIMLYQQIGTYHCNNYQHPLYH